MYCYPPSIKVPSFFGVISPPPLFFHFFANCAAAVSQRNPKKSASQADKETDVVEHKGFINTESLKKKRIWKMVGGWLGEKEGGLEWDQKGETLF